MENTTNFYEVNGERRYFQSQVTVGYGGCIHDISHCDQMYRMSMMLWIEAGMPESPLFSLHHADVDFGGWTNHLHIRMPDGSIFTTK